MSGAKMGAPRRYSEELRRQVRDAYAAGEQYRTVAERLGVSEGWAYDVVSAAGLIRRSTPTWPASLAREALTLYLTGLSCREVAEAMARRRAPAAAPSQQWVYERMRAAGALRSKSRAMEVRETKRYGRDFDALRAEAATLAVERRWSAKQIAKHLGVTHKVVIRVLPPELRLHGREAQLRSYWQSDLPAVEARLDRRAEVIYRRRDLGQTYAQIRAATGLSTWTIGRYLRPEGLISERRSRAARKAMAGRRPSWLGQPKKAVSA